MREIKFRAWNGHKIRYNVNIDKGRPVRYGYQWFNTDNDIREAEPMQYIGIKDTDAVDIYEGDICVNESGRIAKCIYHGPSASFDFVALNAIGVQRGYLPEYKLTVIGNIYENPELLNRESDR